MTSIAFDTASTFDVVDGGSLWTS